MKPQQLPQQYSSAGFNQANRDQVAPSINQITRRPSISTEQPVGPQSIQRADSRIGAAPQAPLQPNTQQISVQRPIQQINAQPQFQPRQILQQVLNADFPIPPIFFHATRHAFVLFCLKNHEQIEHRSINFI